MRHLEISLLGSFQVTLEGERITRFGAGTARALLAYLAVYAQTSHRREVLAGLLWPDRPQAAALQDLRQALSRLRKAIGDRMSDTPLLHVTSRTIQLSPEGGYGPLMS